MVQIDQNICIGCGLCVRDCVAHTLALIDRKAAVVCNNCFGCGHCFAICPVHAISLSDYPMDGVVELQTGKPLIDGDSFLRLVKSRRSIRDFRPQKIEPEIWKRLLEAGRFMPTASNAQDVTYVVIQDNLEKIKGAIWEGFHTALKLMISREGDSSPTVRHLKNVEEKRKKYPQTDPLFFNAPALLIITSAYPLNGGLAAASIELMAHAEGLGVLYNGFVLRGLAANTTACGELGVDKDEIRACMLLGYPNVKYQRSTPRKAANVSWM